MPSAKPRKHVVIIGGGFGGLACARALRKANADVTLIDRRNFHLFQPLLYQVATGSLSPANIAAPLRSIFKRQKNVRAVMANVTGFDLKRRHVLLDRGEHKRYDYLVLAAGSTHHYFGRDSDWEPVAPGLKTVEDATRIRANVLSAFEKAERSVEPAERESLLTFVVVGGGPTGLEMAGTICELARQTMRREFRHIDPAKARVILVEFAPDLLGAFHPILRANAKKQLTELGAEVWNNCRVTDIQPDHVVVIQGEQEKRIETRTVIWAAGVRASPLGKSFVEAVQEAGGSPVELDRMGRVLVNHACSLDESPDVFVIGDLAHFADDQDKPLPGVAPVAMQQGRYVGRLIAADVRDESIDVPFHYLDKGSMATIGRSRAVAETGRIRLSGWSAWMAWLFIHILYLARFENRVLVLLQWMWNYVTRNRAARLITNDEE